MNIKKFYIFLGIVTILFTASIFAFKINGSEPAKNENGAPVRIQIRDAEIRAEEAATPDERAQGLSGRLALADNEGMFFVFDTPDYYQFWMKDMNFPLDIIWIGEDLVIKDIKENISPETFPMAFSPASPALYVLEAQAGFSRKNGLITGDKVIIHEE